MDSYVLLSIGVIALVTAIIRFLPFIVFKKRTPKIIEDIGNMLPFAIMAMLVVYCLKDTDLLGKSHGLSEIIASVSVVLLHKFKHNILLSIVGGTILYMLLLHIM